MWPLGCTGIVNATRVLARVLLLWNGVCTCNPSGEKVQPIARIADAAPGLLNDKYAVIKPAHTRRCSHVASWLVASARARATTVAGKGTLTAGIARARAASSRRYPFFNRLKMGWAVGGE